MAIALLDAVDFSKVPSLQFVVPVVANDPTGYEAGFIYNSTSKQVKYHDGSSWVALGPAGAGGPPTGTAGGDLQGSYPNPTIKDGVIMDVDVNASAAIAQSKIANLTTDLGNRLLKGGDTMSGFLTLSADPTNPLHAASKNYVDITSQGFTFKNAVRIVATGNVTQSGLAAIDGVTPIANDRILCAGQSTASQNGIWLAQSGAWTRALDMDANGELVDGTLVPVAQGTVNADSHWICTATGATPWVPNSSTSTWTRFSSITDLVAGGGLTKTGNTLDIGTANVAHMTVGADTLTIVSAPKWTTGQTITLTGDVTGVSGAWDGSAGLSFATAIGSGVIVDADVNASANIAQTKISGLGTSLSGKVDTTRSVLAGNGLTGGGTLAADVTLNVANADGTLTIAADDVKVASAPKWTSARQINLTGDVTGSTSIDGSGNVSLATTVVNAGKRYATDVGAGTNVVINHALNTLDVTVNVYQKSNGANIMCGVARTDVNNVTLTFATAVSSGVYRVVIVG